jgi:hypothetical protein
MLQSGMAAPAGTAYAGLSPKEPVMRTSSPCAAAVGLVFLLACGSGETGDLGPAGAQGPAGVAGPAGPIGPQGPAGLPCWDLDGDAACTRDVEDRDGNGRCDVADCRGPIGERGPEGDPGVACWDLVADGTCDASVEDIDGDGDCDSADCRGPVGIPGPVGAPGVACWDLVADGTCDPAVEDLDGDGDCDSADCRGPVGPRGEPGLACWDLDQDGACDPEEDVDGNGFCETTDCAAVIQAGPGLTRTGSTFGANLTPAGGLGGASSAVARSDHLHDINALFDAVIQPQVGITVQAPRVDPQGGFVARGELGVGWIPQQGSGVRMMWYPFKGAFRAGGVDTGGEWDDASIGFYSWAGGFATKASSYGSFAFGDQSQATGTDSIAMGSDNVASGTAGVALGASSVAAGFCSTASGFDAQALGQGSVALGYRATAAGDYSLAFGQRAGTGPRNDGVSNTCTTARSGAMVFADGSTTDFFCAAANNELAVRAAGGIRLRTNATATTGCNLAAGSGTWSCTSSIAEKEGFEPVDGETLLERIAALHVSRWRYRGEADGVRHVGPIAEDFHAAFGIGAEPGAIDLVDADGINLAAVQALDARTRSLAARADDAERYANQLADEVARLRAERDDLEARLARLEALLAR